jgi:hypothetical protein
VVVGALGHRRHKLPHEVVVDSIVVIDYIVAYDYFKQHTNP